MSTGELVLAAFVVPGIAVIIWNVSRLLTHSEDHTKMLANHTAILADHGAVMREIANVNRATAQALVALAEEIRRLREARPA